MKAHKFGTLEQKIIACSSSHMWPLRHETVFLKVLTAQNLGTLLIVKHD